MPLSEIEIQHHSVKDVPESNLVGFEDEVCYSLMTIKGIGKEQVVNSVVVLHLDGEGKIQKVEDRWDGELDDGAIADVSISQLKHYSSYTVGLSGY